MSDEITVRCWGLQLQSDIKAIEAYCEGANIKIPEVIISPPRILAETMMKVTR